MPFRFSLIFVAFSIVGHFFLSGIISSFIRPVITINTERYTISSGAKSKTLYLARKIIKVMKQRSGWGIQSASSLIWLPGHKSYGIKSLKTWWKDRLSFNSIYNHVHYKSFLWLDCHILFHILRRSKIRPNRTVPFIGSSSLTKNVKHKKKDLNRTSSHDRLARIILVPVCCDVNVNAIRLDTSCRFT